VDLCSLLNAIVDGARVLCGETHTIDVKCEPGLNIPGESRELHSAFSNLIFNAIKHNPEGCNIDISAKKTEKGIRVRVADDGIGIDPKHLPRLTERFYRVDDSRATASGGTGLGLAIVKHVLNRHNATLKIRSTLGKGSIFSCLFKIPGNPGKRGK
jgi:two-component system phosphate regulon sensor histidine kinase PhoR